MPPINRETIIERRQPHVRWSAIFAGAAVAFSLWMLLVQLGVGLGLTVIDTDDAGNLRGVGIGTGLWSLIAPLIAMFYGAFVVGRMAGTRDRMTAGLHGVVMWALTAAVGVWAMVMITSTMVSRAARIADIQATAVYAPGSIEAKQAALAAADHVGKLLLFSGIAMLLSIVAAAAGAVLGTRQRRAHLDLTTTTTSSHLPPPPPPAPGDRRSPLA